MKKFVLFTPLIMFFIVFLTSCEYDNYEEPKSRLYGKIVYQGEPINVGFNEVTFELWEPGWQLKVPIDVIVAPDGSFSALLFDGTYKLTIPTWQGPFKSKVDTMTINLKRDQELDIEVEPYYMIRNPNFSVSNNVISASFGLEKIITGDEARDIEKVYLYVNKTQFVDIQSNIVKSELSGSDIENFDLITLTTPIPNLIVKQDYLFVRIGVKISHVEDFLYSPVQKINL
jgi:hypothetical protein